MSEKLTREQIELARVGIPLALGRESIGPINALCDLALAGLEVQPRPRDRLGSFGNDEVLMHSTKQGWAVWPASAGWPDVDCFIPVSSLPEPK